MELNKRSSLSREIAGLAHSLTTSYQVLHTNEATRTDVTKVDSQMRTKRQRGLISDNNETTIKQGSEQNPNLLVPLLDLDAAVKGNASCIRCGSDNVKFRMAHQLGLCFDVQLVCGECSVLGNEVSRKIWKQKNSFKNNATNIQAVIATYYNGATIGNTSFLLASLGLPNTAMWRKLHYKHCEEISEKIQQISEEVIEESLLNEIKETMKNKYNSTYRKATAFLSDIKVRNHNKKIEVGLDVSFDMGWQRRSTGHSYNSRSGHAFLIGMQTKKVISMIIFCKDCKTY